MFSLGGGDTKIRALDHRIKETARDVWHPLNPSRHSLDWFSIISKNIKRWLKRKTKYHPYRMSSNLKNNYSIWKAEEDLFFMAFSLATESASPRNLFFCKTLLKHPLIHLVTFSEKTVHVAFFLPSALNILKIFSTNSGLESESLRFCLGGLEGSGGQRLRRAGRGWGSAAGPSTSSSPMSSHPLSRGKGSCCLTCMMAWERG